MYIVANPAILSQCFPCLLVYAYGLLAALSNILKFSLGGGGGKEAREKDGGVFVKSLN